MNTKQNMIDHDGIDALITSRYMYNVITENCYRENEILSGTMYQLPKQTLADRIKDRIFRCGHGASSMRINSVY